LVKHLPDEKLASLKRGGHDPVKVYAAYKAAVDHKGSPTVVLGQTVKGYGLGEAGEGMNSVHQIKKFKEKKKALVHVVKRFDLAIPDDKVQTAQLYKPADDSPEMKYLHQRRKELGGYVPQRRFECQPLAAPGDDFISFYAKGSGEKNAALS